MAKGDQIMREDGDQISHFMNGGDGLHSYAHNSLYQRVALNAAKSMITHSIFEKFELIESTEFASNSKNIKIADFGCSVGPNTFIAVQNIIEAIKLKYPNTLHQTLEFQVFFNDHTKNDFNTLFTTLPPSPPYFTAGVPGSFHRCLFPKASLHVVHSSHALNWLSKIPEELVDQNSPTWNKGKVHYTRDVTVFQAYSKQFKRDMEGFLNARAQEMVGGGLMMFILPGCEDGVVPSETSVSMQFGLFGACLMDMVNMGMTSEEKVDSFNMPLYNTSPMELRDLINANGYFHIERLENYDPFVLKGLPDFHMLAMHLRAAIEGLIAQHFGSEIVEELFERFAKKMAENAYVFDPQNIKEFIIFACLKRKPTKESNGCLHVSSEQDHKY